MPPIAATPGQGSRRRAWRGALLALVLGGCASLGYGAHAFLGVPSDHFDGRRFHNHEPTPSRQLSDFLRKLQPGRSRGAWKAWEETESSVPPRQVGAGALRVTFVNHATVLIQMDDLNILTDPIWSERILPLPTSLVRRHRPPGIRFDDLPPIDLVLVSHNHPDHMDLRTLRRLADRFHPRIVAGLGNAPYLAGHGVAGAEEIDWWQSVDLGGGVRVTGVPARHWSARSLDDVDRTLWLGFVIETATGDVYFAGDTGYTRDFAAMRERFSRAGPVPFRLALLPIAPARPHATLAPRHMSAGDAVRAARVLGAATSIGIHFGTFRQGDDGQEEPVDSLRAALEAARPCQPRFWTLRNGEARAIPPLAPSAAPEPSCALIESLAPSSAP